VNIAPKKVKPGRKYFGNPYGMLTSDLGERPDSIGLCLLRVRE
jgi:hypothetical protein